MKFERWKKIKRKGDALISPIKGIPAPPEGEDCILVMADDETQGMITVFSEPMGEGWKWNFRKLEDNRWFTPTHYMFVQAPPNTPCLLYTSPSPRDS